MKRHFIRLLLASAILLIAADSCRRDEEIRSLQPFENLQINLRWNQAYTSETRQQAETGLQWCLSYLGASLPRSTYADGLTWISSSVVSLYPDKLGFNNNALKAFAALLPHLKNSDEYRQTGAIDMGRFIMLTLNSSNHYYKITGVKENYEAFTSQYEFDKTNVAILQSSVSKTGRLIRLPAGNNVHTWGFSASDGEGSFTDGTFIEKEYEVFDIMPNGQFRFAIYNENKRLVNAANVLHTNAGKPAKCVWCHEVNIQRAFGTTTSVPGYYSIDSFIAIAMEKTQQLEQYRSTLPSQLDFSKKQDHTQMELLYISFMQPSAMRLASEWGMSEAGVREKLSSLNTHLHDEFPFLGELYYRKDVEGMSPFKSVRVPDDAREGSVYEPDLIP